MAVLLQYERYNRNTGELIASEFLNARKIAARLVREGIKTTERSVFEWHRRNVIKEFELPENNIYIRVNKEWKKVSSSCDQ
jgi:hypothetical protein